MKKFREVINRIRNNYSQNAGFTLVELIIVITILAILCGISAVGILSWQDWANFKRENEYAKTLFVAAQNQLSEYSANGRLEEMIADADTMSGDDADTRALLVRNTIDDTIQYSMIPDVNASVVSTVTNRTDVSYDGVIVAITANAGSYVDYLQNMQESDYFWLYELLGSYVYDTGILEDSAIRVEFTPVDGQVLSVYYTDRQDDFGDYGANGYATDESIRRDYMVGYYGVDSLAKAPEYAKKKKIDVSNVKLYNKDTLYLTFMVKKSDSLLLGSSEYNVALLDTDDSKKEILNISIADTLKSFKKSYYEFDTKDSKYEFTEHDYILENPKYYETKATIKYSASDEGSEVPIIAWKESVNANTDKIHVILDAADIEADANTYDAAYLKLKDRVTKNKDTGNDNNVNNFRNTYSFFRFGLEARNIKVRVKVITNGVASKEVENMQLPKNTCFAGGKDTAYSIKNARHLYNIRYMETKSATDARKSGVTYKLSQNIDWNGFQHKEVKTKIINVETGDKVDTTKLIGYLHDSSNKISEELTNGVSTQENYYLTARYNCDFPSLPVIRAEDSLDGNGKDIIGLVISEAANEQYNIYIDNSKYIRPVGLVNINYGTIKDLNMKQFSVSGDEYVGGFVGVNLGKLEKLCAGHDKKEKSDIPQSTVIGKKYVGGIIGIQMMAKDGSIEEMVNYANVEGSIATGGIVGCIRNNFGAILRRNEINQFDGLKGTEKNTISEGNSRITVQKCENYGAVLGCSEQKTEDYNRKYILPSEKVKLTNKEYTVDDPEAIRYIGGIAGYAYNSQSDTGYVVIEECNSSPVYDKEYLTAIMESLSNEEGSLNGVYVGGIVGYNYNGQINSCSTKAKNSDDEGYVVGYKYVGGIVGFNMGPTTGIVVGSDVKGINYNNVIAHEYAGGITGCSSNVEDYDSLNNHITTQRDPEELVGILIPAMSKNLNVKVDNWINKGVVIASSKYAGGITGYNTGWIYRCSSQIIKDQATTMFDIVKTGDYAGGIAGYNNGIIGNSNRKINPDGINSTVEVSGSNLAITSYVRGKNYVGGIVGYNDVDAIVEDYTVKGGYVYSEKGGCFTGGYAGFNASIDLIMDTAKKEPRAINCNPVEVKGDYFVGGIIGGNIINTSALKNTGKDSDELCATFKTDNYLGSLEGKAFVGGFVGYNMLLKSDKNNTVDEVQKHIVTMFADSDDDKLDISGLNYVSVPENDAVQNRLREKLIIVENIHEIYEDYESADTVLIISGDEDSVTSNNMHSIKGQLIVGGVLGFNDNDTNIYLKNIENSTHVIAEEAIIHPEEQTIEKNVFRNTNYAGDDCIYKYSYAGGIIGKVSEKAVVENCSNVGLGAVTAAGTYTGGLCEINEGEIKSCQVKTLSNSDKEYVGGLAGLNKENGKIYSCSFGKQTISGLNVVGGIVAENFGLIEDISLNGSQISSRGKTVKRDDIEEKDGVAGIYAAYNGATGIIKLEKDIEGVGVKSAGQFVGLVAGYNEGYIKNQKAAAGPDSTRQNSIVLKGNLEGYNAVGALCGYNADKDEKHIIYNYTNKAAVKTTMGQAGGIIGVNKSKNTIKYCDNYALVSASDGGSCGGITSVNDSIITECCDYAEVSSPNGICGGIVALNDRNGDISNCHVRPEKMTTLLGKENTLTFSSNYVVGGIAAQNAGKIQSNYLSNIIITNNNQVTGTNMGIICGENLIPGRIFLSDTISITQNNEDAEVINCKVRAESNNCKLGGVAGSNAGTIQGAIDKENPGDIKSVIDCVLEFGHATYGSMGGVAGINKGIIDHIAVDGNIDGLNGGENNGYGGIAGVSGFATESELRNARLEYENIWNSSPEYLAQITNCTFDGHLHAVGSSGTLAEIGGISGFNGIGALISECYIGARDDKELISSGNVTEITAGNTAKDYTLKGTDKLSGSHIGGIAGTNKGRITDCDNNKHSTDEVHIIAFAGDTGGIVGVNDRGGIVSGYVENDTVHKITTGKTWSVDMRCAENNHGPGGIIGRNESGHDIEYVENFGSVTCKYEANDKVGGIVGSNQQKEAGQITFRYCVNYGTITGYGCTGGFMGQQWLRGCVFDHCINYGEVCTYAGASSKQRYIGGFIASFKASNTDLSFISCENHGYIHCNAESPDKANWLSISGFVGYLDDDINITGYMNDCINTGIIEYADPTNSKAVNASAFVSEPNSNMKWYLTLCRNYNTNVPSTYTDAKADGYNGGFVSKGKGDKFTLKDCLDVSNLKASGYVPSQIYAPFGDKLAAASVNNYYVDSESLSDAAEILDSTNHGAFFSAHGGANYDNWYIYRGVDTTKYGYNSYKDYELLFRKPDVANRFYADGSKPLNIKLTPANEFKGISSFVMYLWNGNNDPTNASTKEQKFNVIFVDKNGNKFEADINDVVTKLNKNVYTDDSGKAWLSVTAEGINNKAEGALYNRVEIKVPEGCNSKDVRNILIVNSSAVYLYGFGWIPEDGTNGKDAVLLTGLSDKNGIVVNNFDIKSNNGAGVAGLEIRTKADFYNGYKLKWDFLNWNMYSNNVIDESIRVDTGGTQKVTIDSVQTYESNIGVIAFDIVNNKDYGINKLHLYLTNDSNCTSDTVSANEFYYEYGYKLTDINGTVCTVDISDENLVSEVTDCSDVVIDVASLVESEKLSSKQLSKVEIYVKAVGINGFRSGMGNGDKYIYTKGITYESTDGTGEQTFAAGDKAVASTYTLSNDYKENTGYLGIHRLLVDYENHGGTVQAPYVYTDYDVNRGFTMSSNDPINNDYISDHKQINVYEYAPTSDYSDAGNRAGLVFDSNDKATLTSEVTNSRISVFHDIDPKFVAMIRSMYSSKVKLSTPANPEAKENHGYINFMWDRVTTDVDGNVATPYGYEIKCIIKDKTGKEVDNKVMFQLEQANQARQKLNNLIEIEDAWYENEYTVCLSVCAVNGERFNIDTPSKAYDSDYSNPPVEIKPNKFRLIAPEVHLEMTAGNKMVAVLDNYDEYLERMVTVKDASGKAKEVSMASVCQIKVEYSGYSSEDLSAANSTQGITFTINPSKGRQGRISEESVIVVKKPGSETVGFNLMDAYAVPLAEYADYAMESAINNVKGNGYGNDKIASSDRYANAYFDGFFGESIEAMSYQLEVVGGDDSYIVVDVGAYSEETGTYVYYGNYGEGALHIGGSDGAGTVTASSEVADIPKEWFSADFDKAIEAREHVVYSQRKIIHYGHEVVTGIELEGTKEENQAILSAIKDEYFLAPDKVEYDYPIWENDDLKPGYVLYKNGNGTYDIWYYPTIAFAKAEAEAYNSANNTDLRVYRKYCVDAVVYAPMKDSGVSYTSGFTAPAENYLNLSDFQEGYWMRRQTDSDVSASNGFTAFKKYDYSEKRYTAKNQMQDIFPAPIADTSSDGNAIQITAESDGTRTYNVLWDVFYRDKNCWNQTKGYYADESTKFISILGLDENEHINVPTWEAFREKSAIYDDFIHDLRGSYNNTDRRYWVNAMMNSYYFTYANARYEVYMIGTTLDGTDVILDMKTVDEPESLPSVTGNSYTIEKSNDNKKYTYTDPVYDMWGYRCSFNDSAGNWDQYKTVKIRIVRLGEAESINNDHKTIKTSNSNNIGRKILYYEGNTGADGTISTFELPRYVDYEINQKIKLEKLSPPGVQHIMTNREYPEYKISWNVVHDENQLHDLGGYLLSVKDNSAEETMPTSYYFVESLYDSGFSVDLSNIAFAVDDNDENRIKHIEGDFSDTTCSVSLDMSDYSGRDVEVTVRAIAKDDKDEIPNIYIHGDESDASNEFNVCKTLKTPNVSDLAIVVEDDENFVDTIEIVKGEQYGMHDYTNAYYAETANTVSEEEFGKGFVLKYTNNTGALNSDYDISERYKVVAAIAVYDSVAPAELDSKVRMAAGDDKGTETGKEYWNTGAYATIYDKSNSLVVVDASVNPIKWISKLSSDKLLAEYAGKYLKIVLKSTSVDLIDSAWTDEDIEGATVNYVWIHIPELYKADPELGSDLTPLGAWSDDMSEYSDSQPMTESGIPMDTDIASEVMSDLEETDEEER